MNAIPTWKIKMRQALVKINSFLMFTHLLMDIRESNKIIKNPSQNQENSYIPKEPQEIIYSEKHGLPESIELSFFQISNYRNKSPDNSFKDHSEIPIMDKKDENLGLNVSFQDNSTLRLKIYQQACYNYTLENPISFHINEVNCQKSEKKCKLVLNLDYFKIENEERFFLFYLTGRKEYKIECFYISYRIKKEYSIRTPEYLQKKFLRNLKFSLMIAIYLVLLFYIAGFVQTIYINYGSNFYKLFFIPWISLLFFNLVISTNIMILLSTVLMYFYGYDFVYRHTNLSLFRIIFNGLVPKDAQILHKTILDIKSIFH